MKPVRLHEWQFQAPMIAEFHKLEDEGYPLTCAGDMNQAKRSLFERARAKVTGLTAGEPDVRVYFESGRLVLVELKRRGGVLSEAQKKRIPRLRELGFTVLVYWIESEEEAREIARGIAAEFSPMAFQPVQGVAA